jgi:hypothetical protein
MNSTISWKQVKFLRISKILNCADFGVTYLYVILLWNEIDNITMQSFHVDFMAYKFN